MAKETRLNNLRIKLAGTLVFENKPNDPKWCDSKSLRIFEIMSFMTSSLLATV